MPNFAIDYKYTDFGTEIINANTEDDAVNIAENELCHLEDFEVENVEEIIE